MGATAKGAARLRLGVAAALFVGWLGWLLYLALATRDLIVLSRPQFLVSPLWVIARIEEAEGRPAPDVLVRDVVRSPRPHKLVGEKIMVAGLSAHTAKSGWAGPGDYILPLTETQAKFYRVTPLPLSPGFAPSQPGESRIYPLNDETRAQLDTLLQMMQDER